MRHSAQSNDDDIDDMRQTCSCGTLSMKLQSMFEIAPMTGWVTMRTILQSPEHTHQAHCPTCVKKNQQIELPYTPAGCLTGTASDHRTADNDASRINQQ